MQELQIKAGGEVKDVDRDGRTILAYMSVFGNVDSDGDVIERGAFQESVAREGPDGSDRIWHFRDHDPSQRINKPRRITEDEHGLLFETYVPETTLGNDVLTMYDAVGQSMEHSVGMHVMDTEPLDQAKGERIKTARLREGSTVAWGANVEARLHDMKSDADLIESEFIAGHVSRLKSLLKEDLSDELMQHIELEVQIFEAKMREVRALTKEKEKAEQCEGERARAKADEVAQRLNQKTIITTLTNKAETLCQSN